MSVGSLRRRRQGLLSGSRARWTTVRKSRVTSCDCAQSCISYIVILILFFFLTGNHAIKLLDASPKKRVGRRRRRVRGRYFHRCVRAGIRESWCARRAIFIKIKSHGTASPPKYNTVTAAHDARRTRRRRRRGRVYIQSDHIRRGGGVLIERIPNSPR